MPATPDIRIVCATTGPQLADASELFLAYAESLGWDLSQGGRLAEEIDRPPGPYAEPGGALLVAYAAEQAVGVVGLQPVPPDARVPGSGAETAGELKRLFVRPEWRRRGIAHALMRRVRDEALARGYDSLVLTTSAEMMPLAQPFYDALGYHETVPYRSDMDFPNIRWMKLEL